MPATISRSGRRPLALSLVGTIALAACADERGPTEPPPSHRPSLAVEDAPDTLIVTNTSGGTDIGSLRWAASQAPFRAIIRFDPNLAGKTIVVDTTVHATQFVFIEGPEDRGITISGGGRVRVMEFDQGASISNVNVKDGYHPHRGGGILSSSNQLDIDWSAVYDNRAPIGAAIFAEGHVAIFNSTIARTDAGATGSLIEIGPTTRLTLNHGTVYGSGPGPVVAADNVSLRTPIVGFANAIIAGGGPNCDVGLGFEHWGMSVSDDASCGVNAHVTVADPRLGPLGDNGGPTTTMPILKDSPAVNGGQDCLLNQDQRHVVRDAICDPGAFEFTDFTRVTITIDPAVKVDAATGQALLSGTIKCTRDEYFQLALELHQDQKVGKQVVDVHSADDFPLECTTGGASWHAHMPLSAGQAFKSGAGRAIAYTLQTPVWVAPAHVERAVKLSVTRK